MFLMVKSIIWSALRKKGKIVSLAVEGQGVALAGGQGGVTSEFFYSDSVESLPKEPLQNSRLNIDTLQNCVGLGTENLFDDSFWENLTVVVNALHNVTARLNVDPRCVYFQKPLLETGTLGAKCNTQMVIPRPIENYGASDPPEEQASMCTVHSFVSMSKGFLELVWNPIDIFTCL